MRKYSFLTIILLTSYLYSSINNVAFTQDKGNAANQTKIKQKPIKLNHWSIQQDLQEKDNSANTSFWIDVSNEKVLVLMHRARGRLFRGNVILLHAQQENANHPKVIQPLAFQLTQLGWQVFIPNLPLENFPIKAKSSIDSKKINKQANSKQNQQQSSKPKKKYFFQSSDAYQTHINQTILKVIAHLESKTGDLVLIGNKNTAYWLLDSTKGTNDIQKVVLIDPQLPKQVNIDLETQFKSQLLPVYTFIKNNHSSTKFLDLFEQKLWKSKFQRLNRNLITHQSILIEDNRIAKSITGWIENQKKK